MRGPAIPSIDQLLVRWRLPKRKLYRRGQTPGRATSAISYAIDTLSGISVIRYLIAERLASRGSLKRAKPFPWPRPVIRSPMRAKPLHRYDRHRADARYQRDQAIALARCAGRRLRQCGRCRRQHGLRTVIGACLRDRSGSGAKYRPAPRCSWSVPLSKRCAPAGSEGVRAMCRFPAHCARRRPA
jgi:hypothetical protein